MKNWPTVRLSEVAELCLGKMLDAKKNKGRLFPYLRNPNVRWFDVDTSELKEMPFEEHELERYGLRDGDVVVCEGGEAGRAAIWDGRLPNVKFQKAIHRVRTNGRLHNRYLVYRLMADYQSGRLADYYTGATIQHLTGQDLARYELPLPPIAEQRRIAEVLDRADALRVKRRAMLAQLAFLRRSVFLEIFGDVVRNPKRWPTRRLKECASIQIGPFGSLLHQEDYVSDGIPLVNPKHIEDGKIVPSCAESVTRKKHAELGSYHLRENDIVMGRRGEMGRCAVVGPEHDGLLCGTGSLLIRVEPSVAVPVFVCAALSSSAMKVRLERLSLGATLPNLNTRIIEELEIPMPPLTAQRTFAEATDRVEKLTTKGRVSLGRLNSVFESLQHRAFRGEL